MSVDPNAFWNNNSFDSAEKAANSLTQNMMSITETAIQQNGRCVWAVSGGSSILKLYDALTDFRDKIAGFGKNLVVVWVDERVVPHTHERSNYGDAYNYFWKQFENTVLIPVPFEQNSKQATRNYESILRNNRIEKGRIDITILGMGTDGHTASLFPYNSVLEEKEHDIVAVSDPSVTEDRISMTFAIINSSNAINLFFYGSEKAKTLKDASLSGKMEQYPILGINRDKLVTYSDQDLGNR